MFNLLDRYIMGNFLVALGLSVFAMAGMFWLGQSVVLIDQIVLRGESAATFISLSTKLIPKILLNVTPVAALAAALISMNSMANHAELVVMGATGRRPMRAVKPFAFLGVFLAIFLWVISMYAAPKSSYELRESLREIQSNFSNNVILSGRFVFPMDKVAVFAEDSLLSGEMVNLFIEDRREKNVVRTYFAERGVYAREGQSMKLALIKGEFHEHDLKTNAVSRAYFDRTEITMDNLSAAETSTQRWRDDKTFPELLAELNKPEEFSRYLSEIFDRLFYPLLGFILPVIAVVIFQQTPYSRHGYGRTVARAAVIGLSLTALQLAVPTLMDGNPKLFWVALVPLATLIVIYLSAFLRGY